jgi:hypothetical protein
MRRAGRCVLFSGISIAALTFIHSAAPAQTNLPQVTVTPPKPGAVKPLAKRAARRRPAAGALKAQPTAPLSPPVSEAGPGTPAAGASPAAELAAKTATLD